MSRLGSRNTLVRRLALGVAASVVGSGLAAVPQPPAQAEVDLTGTLDLPAGVTATVAGSSAVEAQKFNDFPSKGSDYLVLSTGNADDVMLPAPLAIDDPRTPVFEREPDPLISTDRGGDGVPDATTLTLTVLESTGAGCLYVDFSMATDETARAYQPGTPGDSVSVTRRSAPGQEYAMNAGRGYFAQSGWAAEPRPYTTNDIAYWHKPGDLEDVDNGQLETPRLARWTPLSEVTTRDTARVPLAFSGGSDVVDVVVSDRAGDNGELDTAAFVDNVRLSSTCESGAAAQPAYQYGEGSIKGERRVGYPLTYDPVPSTPQIERYDATDNGWTHPAPAAPVDLRFRWYRASATNAYKSDMNLWTPIPDADRQSYVPTNLDRGKVLIVLVTGVVDGRPSETRPNTVEAGTAPQSWYVTLPIDYGVFQDGSTPTIEHDGTPKVGEQLTVRPVATRPLQDSWSYQWYADGSAITGATSDSLVLAAGQRGKRISVRATAQRSQFESRSWTSVSTPVVDGEDMESQGTPTIATPTGGTSVPVGTVLDADPGQICEVPEPSGGACAGKWPSGTSFTYQWKRDGQNISGATGATYTTVTQDVGKTLTLVVSGSKPGYDPVSATTGGVTVSGSSMTGAVPTISGTPQVGQRLTGTVENWVPSGSTLTYSWSAGGDLLQEGTSRYLTVPASAAGQRVELTVTGRKNGYEPLAITSEPTEPVELGNLTSGTLRVTGWAKVGRTLTLIPGYWAPSGVKLSYRWQVGSKPVTGKAGSKSTFRIPKSARGKKIRVKVTGKLAGYQTEKVLSRPTAKVVR